MLADIASILQGVHDVGPKDICVKCSERYRVFNDERLKREQGLGGQDQRQGQGTGTGTGTGRSKAKGQGEVTGGSDMGEGDMGRSVAV